VEHARADFELPPGSSDDFVLVEVTMFAGRSRQAKRRLYQALVRNFGTLGVAPADVFVVLQEPPMDNWGIRGGPDGRRGGPGVRGPSLTSLTMPRLGEGT
jgi:phenylpyruvate tautomerase PptA (4-oxalocrotonate tautomerase family)